MSRADQRINRGFPLLGVQIGVILQDGYFR